MRADNRLIYAARVTSKLGDGEYFRDRKWQGREDCVYEWHEDHFEWRQRALHHGPKHLIHDLGEAPGYDRANVLLSKNFHILKRKADNPSPGELSRGEKRA
jgi:hypothetical protein